jgi:YjjG family noncanonical pyrimidine nucleotidase
MSKNNELKFPRKHSCVFFDLDHTLWDYEANSCETLVELYDQYNLQSKGIETCESFVAQFKIVNTTLWDLYDRGSITSDVIRKERFKQIFQAFHACDDKLCIDLSDDYLTQCPQKGYLMPHAVEVLQYLAETYHLSIITNGFEEIQHQKLRSSNLLPYFDHIITSQRAGSRKPSCGIFNFALEQNAIKHHEAIMVGDNLITDIGGASNAYIDAVYFNPEKNVHDSFVAHEINCLSELRRIL